MRKFTDEELLKRAEGLCPPLPVGYWIIGVRSKADAYNEFDDKFFLFKGRTFLAMATGTTNPGAYALQHFDEYGATGAFVLEPDQFVPNMWIKGYHKGKVIALVDRMGAKYKCRRDSNHNRISGDTPHVYTETAKGINFHPATYNLGLKRTLTKIEAWSAGCQVVNDVGAYTALMAHIPDKTPVSYCLLREF